MAKKQFPWLQDNSLKTTEVNGVRITYKNLAFGEDRRIQNEAVKYDSKTGKPSGVDITLMGVATAVAKIVDWELTDGDGEKLPISVETFDNVLNGEWATDIIDAVNNDNKKVTEEKKKK